MQVNLKVRRNGDTVELRKVELESLSPPLFRTYIGYNSLKRLGYSISFIRPKKSSSGDFERIRYNFMERGVMTRQLEDELEPDMKRGILNQLPRGNFAIILLLTQVPRRGVNIRLDKFMYDFLGCILMRNDEVLDVVMNTAPTRDILMPIYDSQYGPAEAAETVS
ncbi:MAG: hypothetical protein EAX95_05715 [Candidatus Thorarchaeota archaeon]|nr:hypothetical protein [Candidatus Thorarchaeota archaeon]